MASLISKWEAQQAIVQAAYDRLNGRIGDGEALEEIRSVHFGNQSDDTPRTPMLWVLMGECREYDQDQRTLGGNYEYDQELRLQVIYEHRNSMTAQMEALRLASEAFGELLKADDGSRSERLGLPGYVVAIHPGRDRAIPIGAEELAGHEQGVRVIFRAQRY